MKHFRTSALTLALLLTGSLTMQAEESRTARGCVFLDQNGNGRLDSDEQGIAGVCVSNGRDVVVTDERGRYALPVGDDTTIFVIKPAGYRSPLSDDYTPLYYYTHKRYGSLEGLKYPAFAPTGELPEEINFPLEKYDEPTDYSVLLFGDPQPHSEKDLSYFSNRVLTDVKRRMPADALFGISLGDLAWDYLELEPLYKHEMAKLQLPWHNVMGNHDMNVDSFILDDHDSDETFEYYYGPATYAFNYGKVHYVIMDDILFPDPRRRTKYWGGYREDQLDFLENDLRQLPHDQLIVLSQHIQLTDEPEDDGHFRPSDRERLFRILAPFDNVLILSAHTHYQDIREYGPEQGWHGKGTLLELNLGTSCGDWYSGKIGESGFPDATMRDGTPQGFGVLNVRGGDYTYDYRVLEREDDYRMNVYAPRVISSKGGTTARIVANIFLGQKGDKVEYRIGDGKWRRMSYTPHAFDPHYMELLREWDYSDTLMSGRRPSNAIPVSHIWTGRIDRGLTPGDYTVEVRTTDRFGRTYSGTTTMRVE